MTTPSAHQQAYPRRQLATKIASGDLTEDHDHAGLGARLARHVGIGVLGEARVEDGIGALVADRVGEALQQLE